MNGTRTITVAELRDRIEAGTIDEFWNVLTDEYFSGELIPGSRRMPLDRIGRSVGEISRDSAIVVYCTNVDCPQSHAAAEKLAALGFTDVSVFAEGLDGWETAGLPLVMAAPKVA
jgi:rhodanese-related sulfurtransferase